MSEKLKACPFCGGMPEVLDDGSNEVVCRKCDLWGMKVSEWNTRAMSGWTDEDMRYAFRLGWNYNDGSNYIKRQKDFDDWLASHKERKEGKG